MRGIKTTAMIDYALKYVKLLQSYCANIIMVFDGRSLPAKSGTEAKRRENREKAKIKANELSKSGRHDEARKEFSKAVVITHDYALELMEECRKINVECIVAMYEADAQLAYLNKIGLADYIISEDSDLILFGCKKIVYKLTLDGKCTIFDSEKLYMTFPKYSFEKFRRICILSGCDYLNNLPGVGLSKAKKFILLTAETDMKKAIPKIPPYLNLKITIPDDYIENFMRAEATFKYMYVYDPIKKSMVRLNELTDEEDEQYCVNAGVPLKPDVAYQLALGNINPKTMQIVSDYDPLKPKTLSRASVSSTKYKPLFKIWDYSGKHAESIKVKQQSKISFPMKFKKPEIAKIAEEENDVEDQIEMDSLISAYCDSEVPSTSSKIGTKRPNSVLNEEDLNDSIVSSPKNPFAKRQSLDKNAEKADSCSLIKSLGGSCEASFAEARVVSRFFGAKREIEDPLTIIERIENAKITKEIELEENLERNKQFYSISKKFSNKDKVNDEDDKSPLEKIKEKYVNGSSKINSDSADFCDIIENKNMKSPMKISLTYESQSLEIEQIEILDDDDSSEISSNASQPIKQKSQKSTATKAANVKKTKSTKSTSLSLSSQHKLSKFGFTKSSKIL